MAVDLAALRRIQSFLLDLDGTIYLGRNIIPGAVEFIAYLRESGRKFLFFTNNSSKNAREYAKKLGALGIACEAENILSSGEATVRYLLSETAYRRVYAVGTPSFEGELRDAGLELAESKPEAVVIGFDNTLTYAKLERACLLLREGLPYFATNPDKVCPTEYGYIPDCGSIAALLREATGRIPEFIGKPNPAMIRMGMRKIGATCDTTAMVGDRLYTDMQMAYNAGTASVLLLSGETKRADLDAAERRPEFVFESVRELHEALRDG
ncbi:MAG: HAD-IIA family hydrolase [Candidatus Hydrogenedentes bacterium]|nr:HAD-IIA family hydrolase [Candidatus Hydrogenedentota bacterium]